MNCVQSGDPGGFLRKACLVVAVARDGKKGKVLGATHTSKMFIQGGRRERRRHRVVDMAKVFSNALAEGSTCLADVALAAGGTLDHIDDGG